MSLFIPRRTGVSQKWWENNCEGNTLAYDFITLLDVDNSEGEAMIKLYFADRSDVEELHGVHKSPKMYCMTVANFLAEYNASEKYCPAMRCTENPQEYKQYVDLADGNNPTASGHIYEANEKMGVYKKMSTCTTKDANNENCLPTDYFLMYEDPAGLVFDVDKNVASDSQHIPRGTLKMTELMEQLNRASPTSGFSVKLRCVWGGYRAINEKEDFGVSQRHAQCDEYNFWTVSDVKVYKKRDRDEERFDNDTLRQAVKSYLDNATECEKSSGPINTWDVSAVTDMSSLFVREDGLATVFKADISEWKVGNVNNMSSMFKRAYNFSSDLSKWNVSNVTDMSSMFMDAYYFSSDLSEWNVSKVTNMSSMFKSAIEFTGD